jgi:hypothetical protein
MSNLFIDSIIGEGVNRPSAIAKMGELGEVTRYFNNMLDAGEVINDNIVMTGNTAATTTTYMQYAYNVITTATSSNYAARLPFPPVKGKNVVIINTSGIPIVIYPSVEGGSINGVVNGSALIPSDGKAYAFFCYENPQPGAWSWTSPAINQYDSGEVSVNSTGGSRVLAINGPANYIEGDGFYVSTGWSFNGLNQPLISTAVLQGDSPAAFFKPSAPWNQITKIKVYTNLSALNDGIQFAMQQSSNYNNYNTTTGAFVSASSSSGTIFDDYYAIDSTVSGASLGRNVLTNNIGDAGTVYREVSFPNIGNGGLQQNVIGDYYIGQNLVSGILRDVWLTRCISFQLQPNASLTGLKVRFFIEYN